MSENASEFVRSKVHRHFREADRETVLTEFADHDITDERVQLAIIKLSDGNLAKLREFIGIAKVDWRDVLSWAEYPEEFAAPTWRMDPEKAREVRECDRKQYQAWLGTGD